MYDRVDAPLRIGIIKVLVSSVLHGEKLNLIWNKILIIDFSKKGYHFWVPQKNIH